MVREGFVVNTAATPGDRLAEPRLSVSADHPLVAGAIAGSAAAVFVVLRLGVMADWRITRFIVAGSRFVDRAQAPTGLAIVPRAGYDGQFFYRLALDPANLHVTAFGITVFPLFRLQRIGYPVLTWLAALGHDSWVPVAMVVVNGLAIAAIAFLGAVAARQAGRHALWGLLVAAYFGFVFSVGRDTAEPVEAAFLIAGLLAYRRRRPVLAGLLLAFGALTRETVLVAVAALALTRLVELVRRRARVGASDLAWVIPPIAFVAWQVVVRAVIGVFPLTSDADRNLNPPFLGLYHGIKRHLTVIVHGPFTAHAVPNELWVLQVIVLGVVVVAAVRALPTTTAPVHERVAFVLYVLELGVLSPSIWLGMVDLRSLDEVYVVAMLLLLALPSRITRVLPAMALSVCPVVALVLVQRIVSL